MLAQAQLMQQQMFGGGLGQNAWGAAGQQPMQQQMQMPYGMPQQVCFISLAVLRVTWHARACYLRMTGLFSVAIFLTSFLSACTYRELEASIPSAVRYLFPQKYARCMLH